MSREILFRGKRIDNGEWVDGFLFEYAHGGTCIGHEPLSANDYSEIYSSCYCVVDPATVGQYTGLTDKRGRKIFEGDILRDDMGWVFEVRWDNDNGRFLGHHSKPRGDTYICYVGRVDKHDKPSTEVIGNIHDTELKEV